MLRRRHAASSGYCRAGRCARRGWRRHRHPCPLEIWHAAGVEHGDEIIGERRLAAVHGGEMQQADIDAAGLARLEPCVERLPSAAEDRAREQLVAEYRM